MVARPEAVSEAALVELEVMRAAAARTAAHPVAAGERW
jgi:hypothetical protein